MPNEEDIETTKSSLSEAQSYEDIGEFWDSHSLADYWEQTHPAEFIVNIQSEEIYYRIDAILAEQIQTVAQRRGISPEILLNLWVQEKIHQEIANQKNKIV